ncbi:MAG TPA: carboxy terminal-processing peptidase, partial [Chitinophaga sp.]
ILLPDIYKPGQVREAAKPAVLPWDSVKPARITRWQNAPDLRCLAAKAGRRQLEDTLFAAIQQQNTWLAAHDTAAVPVSVDGYRQFAAARREHVNTLNQLLKVPTGKQDNVSPASFTFMKEPVAYRRWLALVQLDLYVHTVVGVLAEGASSH